MDSKTFVIYVAIREQEKIPVYSKKQVQVGALIIDEAPTAVPAEYSNYNNVFSAKYAVKLLKHTEMNDYAIKLEKSKQPTFGPIYSLGPVELEILKTYIKITLANGFIWPSKSPTRAFILFNRKPNRSSHFCVDYWGLNNITIKN